MALTGLLISAHHAAAQVKLTPIFSQLRLEARADFNYMHTSLPVADDEYGFQGKYFNFVAAGNLNDKFSYLFRQRIVATPGTSTLFDNTDFLYLNFKPNDHWMFRLGKDALAVGGFEYDASPIDVLFSTVYWNNFYCFQLGGAAAYTTAGGKNTVMLQVANSPTVYYGSFGQALEGSEWRSGLLAYSLYWSGNFGHFKTLYSVNMFERPDKEYMNYIALGHKVVFDRWDIYFDFIHHALTADASEWGQDYAVASCLNVLVADDLNLFAKFSYEQNLSDIDLASTTQLDFLLPAGMKYTTAGGGFEYNPAKCKDVRLHGFLAWRRGVDTQAAAGGTTETLTGNVGITWHMNIHRMFKEHNL